MKNIRINKNKHSALKIDMGPHFDLKSEVRLVIGFALQRFLLDCPLDVKVRKNMQNAAQYFKKPKH